MALVLYRSKQTLFLVSIYTGGRKSYPVGRREEVTCHPETRDHRCDMRTGRCHGDRWSSCRCEILSGRRQQTRHGIYMAVSVVLLQYSHILEILSLSNYCSSIFLFSSSDYIRIHTSPVAVDIISNQQHTYTLSKLAAVGCSVTS